MTGYNSFWMQSLNFIERSQPLAASLFIALGQIRMCVVIHGVSGYDQVVASDRALRTKALKSLLMKKDLSTPPSTLTKTRLGPGSNWTNPQSVEAYSNG